MKNRSIRSFALAVMLLCAASAFAGPSVSADDFLPPAQAKPEQRAELLTVKNPDAVQTVQDPATNTPVVKAATVQDAINSIAEQFIRQAGKGCKVVSSPSGKIIVAGATASYDRHGSNPVMLRIGHRNAYVVALANAKAQMAAHLKGFRNDSYESFVEWVDHADSDSAQNAAMSGESTSKRAAGQDEVIAQTTRYVLKGFVTYAVSDNKEKGKVTVVIASSPKTRGQFARPTADSVSAASLRDGLNAVLAEIQNGLVPPVGGRIVTVPGTNETGFVGFGSAVVRPAAHPDDQTDNEIDAQRAAQLRANSALVGCIIGDDTASKENLDSATLRSVETFEKFAENDASVGGSQEEVAAVAASRKRVLNAISSESQSSAITSLRRGMLPPGVQTYSWLDDDNYFAYAMAIYIPSLSDEAVNAAKQMEDTKILREHKPDPQQPYDKRPDAAPETKPDVKTDDTPAPKKKASDTLKQGPTGVVRQDL